MALSANTLCKIYNLIIVASMISTWHDQRPRRIINSFHNIRMLLQRSFMSFEALYASISIKNVSCLILQVDHRFIFHSLPKSVLFLCSEKPRKSWSIIVTPKRMPLVSNLLIQVFSHFAQVKVKPLF